MQSWKIPLFPIIFAPSKRHTSNKWTYLINMDIYWLYQHLVRINPTAAGRTGVGAVFPATNSILNSAKGRKIYNWIFITYFPLQYFIHVMVINQVKLGYTITLIKLLALQKKMRFYIKDFCSTCDQIRSLSRIWLHLLKISLMENFIFCIVLLTQFLKIFLPKTLI